MILISLLALIVPALGGHAVNVGDIVQHASSAMQADWAAAPGFAFVQRDVTTSKGMITSKTQQVFMIEGSDYYMPIAINDQPLPANQQKLELWKLKSEVEHRSQETPEEAERRAQRYRKTREQNGILIQEFTQAFDFTWAGEEAVNGHACYVLDAKPKPDYRPPNRTAKILTGMQGRLWIDKDSFHWVKAEAEALKPVSIFGLFARVLPGTRMELEMTPVTDSIWQVSRFTVDLRLAIFWRNSVKETASTFSDYRPAATTLAQALSNEK
jgi:hypothetical protein